MKDNVVKIKVNRLNNWVDADEEKINELLNIPDETTQNAEQRNREEMWRMKWRDMEDEMRSFNLKLVEIPEGGI